MAARRGLLQAAENLPTIALLIGTVGGCAYSGLVAGPDYTIGQCALNTALITGGAIAISVILKSIANSEYSNVRSYEDAKTRYEESYQAFKSDYLRTFSRHWESLSGIEFESEVAKVFQLAGHSVTRTPFSGDEGIDLLITSSTGRTIVQCKAHKNPVGPSVVRDLYGAMLHSRAQGAILISRSGFTQGVFDFAYGKPIELLTGDDLIRKYHEAIRKDPRFRRIFDSLSGP